MEFVLRAVSKLTSRRAVFKWGGLRSLYSGYHFTNGVAVVTAYSVQAGKYVQGKRVDASERTEEDEGIWRGRGRRWVEDVTENNDDGEEGDNKTGGRGRRKMRRTTIRSRTRTPVTRGRGLNTKSAKWPAVGAGQSENGLGVGFWEHEEHEVACSWLRTLW